MWQPNRPTRIEVDASGYATGGVLFQRLPDNLWHPVAYRSQSMADAERNYEVYDKEMLAIIRALEDWRHYLEGLPQPFDIITDHRNLQYWRTAQDLTRRQARWSLYLSRFDFRLFYKPGTANTQVDPLSRLPIHLVPDSADNLRQVVLRLEHFAQVAATSTETSDTLERDIKAATDLDPEVRAALTALKLKAPSQLSDDLLKWEVRDDLVFFKGRLYISRTLRLRQKSCNYATTPKRPGILDAKGP